MQYHKTTYQILDLLKEHGFWYETFEHEPVRTSEEASKLRTGYTIVQGAKSIIIKIKTRDEEIKERFVMLVLPGDAKFDKSKVKEILNAKDLRFANEEEVTKVTEGIKPGGIPPFGNLFGITVIVDPILYLNEKIIFNAGDKSFSIGIYSKNHETLVKPIVKTII
jgi:Ala-tRNA(Pro) deacylase